MGSSANYKAYLDRMEREGISNYDAGRLDGADEAHALDQQADFNAAKAATTAQWLRVDAKGNPTVEFTSQEEVIAAMRDPLYKTSPAYRAAVENCISRMTPDSTPAPNIEHGVAKGFNVDSMEQAALQDAARTQYRHMVKEAASDPIKRLEYLQLLKSTDPSVQAWIAAGTDAIGTEGPGQRMMREAGSGSFGPDLGKAMIADEDNSNGPATEGEVPA